METENPNMPPSIPVTREAAASSADMRKAFEDLRGKLNKVLDDSIGANVLAAVRCGGGCHQGVID